MGIELSEIEEMEHQMRIIAIDPGNEYSAYVVMDAEYKPLDFGKVENAEMRRILLDSEKKEIDKVVVEMIVSYGMGVGQSVFDTCLWIGRFSEIATMNSLPVEYIFRREEKMNLCNNMKAKDSNIRIALVDRFAQHDKKTGKGTKNNPDWFYGFKSDCWSAYAVGTTYLDKCKGDYKNV